MKLKRFVTILLVLTLLILNTTSLAIKPPGENEEDPRPWDYNPPQHYTNYNN